ncbi:TatD family hydrolase [Oligella urethralis]|uniref:DNAase n=1 Tax=Oligella urethralis DNF00040 TaxID=1401065 RepID=A0A095Z6M1_9BURK|nr:TatD family hydrolase [Oligella urethralis]KGF29991.1 DNAase [Oligella urethralis DNF00040]
MFIDSHCHLDFPELVEDQAQVLAAMKQNDVGLALCISVSVPNFPGVLKLAEEHDHLWASIGVHPQYEDTPELSEADFAEYLKHPKIVAVGETGLDYYWGKEPLDWQRDRFRTHIRAAIAADVPLIIHTREAKEDTLRILKEEGAERCGGVMHCFTEDWAMAQEAMALGFYISMSGIVTFKNAQQVQEVATKTPLERLLIETDSPYLAPVPYRGKRNDPSLVIYVAEKIAELKQISVQEVKEATTENFFNLFKKVQRSAL